MSGLLYKKFVVHRKFLAQIRNGQHIRNEKMRLTFEQQTCRDFRGNGTRRKEKVFFRFKDRCRRNFGA